MKLRKVLIITSIITFLLLVSAITISILWPAYWNSQLLSLFLNIAASLIGVLVGIFVAIFIVEKYLEQQRLETQKREQLFRDVYMDWWRGWISGGLSVLSAIVLHLSSFILYGSLKWQDIMFLHDKKVSVPNGFGDFILWLMNNKDVIEAEVTEKQLTRFEKTLNKASKSPIAISMKDLEIVVNYLELCARGIRNQLFLLQPFIDQHFRLASRLVFFASSLELAVRNIGFSLTPVSEEGKSPFTFELSDKVQQLILSIAKEALKVNRLILAEHEGVAKGDEDSQK